jgi:type III secretion protein SpaR/YscT/HrcT
MDYVDLLEKSKLIEMSPVTLLSLFFLALARMMPIVAQAPFFGAKIIPHSSKVMLCICLLCMVAPKLALSTTGPIGFDVMFMVLLAKELLIGTIIGFFISLPFLILSSSGVLIDHQRGAASLMTNDPTIQNQTSPMGTLFNMVLIVLFFNLNGPFYVMETIFSSYDLVPPDKLLSPVFFIPTSPLHERTIHEMQVFVVLMLQFAMPGLLVVLMTDTFLGIINRMAPQIQITFLGMGFKSWLAILIVCLGWSTMVEQMSKQILLWMQEFMRLVQEIAIGQNIT